MSVFLLEKRAEMSIFVLKKRAEKLYYITNKLIVCYTVKLPNT